MVAVYIDPIAGKYVKQIKFSIEYLLKICGFSWRYLDEEIGVLPNDIILYYSPKFPDEVYANWMIENTRFIFIPFVKDFYVQGFFTGDVLKQNMKTFVFEVELPYISTTRVKKTPINMLEKIGHKYYYLDFDMIGNIFFHLVDEDRHHLKKTDKNGNLSFEELGFYGYFNIPYMNHLADLFIMLVRELTESKNNYAIRSCLWPGDQNYAVTISHNLDKLTKWSIGTIISSFFKGFIHFITFRWNIIYRDFFSILKFLFTNDEFYWNFYDITSIEKKEKVKSTWFIGINKDKKLYDYDFDDPDIMRELQEIINNGSEIALLYKSDKKAIEDIRRDFEVLIPHIRIKNSGIRHLKYFKETENLDKFQQDLGIKFDSTRRVYNKNAFYNGFALPYPMFIPKNPNIRQNVMQFPITFSDELLMLNKYKYMSIKDATEVFKELQRKVKKVKGLLHIQFTNSLYHDIKYLPKFHEYIIDEIKNQNGYITTCSDILEWFEKRSQIKITEEPDKIIIKFLAPIDTITFEIIGKRGINNVFGGNCSYKKNTVQFVNTIKNMEVEINLFPIDTPKVELSNPREL